VIPAVVICTASDALPVWPRSQPRPNATLSRSIWVFAAPGLKGYGKRLWSAGQLLIIRDLISFIVYWNCRVVGSEIEFGDWSGEVAAPSVQGDRGPSASRH
jgi:hypothetical protein